MAIIEKPVKRTTYHKVKKNKQKLETTSHEANQAANALINENEDLKKRTIAQKEEIDQKTAEISRLRAENKKLANRRKDSGYEEDEEEIINRIIAEKAKIKAQIKELEKRPTAEQLAETEKKMLDANEVNTKLQNQIASLKKDYKQAQKKKENEVKKYKEGYDNLTAQIERNFQLIKEEKKIIEEKAEEIEAKARDLLLREGEVNAIENALKNVLGIEDIKEKLAVQNKEIEKIRQEKAGLETKLTEKNAEITDLTEKITATEAEFTQKSEELNEIRAEKNDVEKAYNEAKREKTAAEKEHEAVKEELTREQDAHKDTQNALAAEKDAHALTAATKNKKEKELNDNLEKTSEQLSKEQKKTQSLQTKCHELRQEKSTLQDNFNQQERENEILIRLNTDLHHQLEAALKNYQQTKNKLQTKQTANQQLSQDLEKLQAD
ncbi:28311_t:CDS:2, partial [Racocetra persica]